MERLTASHENDPNFLKIVEPETDVSPKLERAKSNLHLVTEVPEKRVKKFDKFFLKRADSTLILGKKEIDLSIDGRQPSYPARGKNVFVFSFGTSRYTIFKEKGKLYGQAILFGKESPRVLLKEDWDIVNQISAFKGNVKFNTRKVDAEDTIVTGDAEDTIVTGDVEHGEVSDESNAVAAPPDEQPGLVVPLRESTDTAFRRDYTRAPSVERVSMVVNKEFDTLVASPPGGVESAPEPDQPVTEEQKAHFQELLTDARGTSAELVQSLADKGMDGDHYASLSVEFSTEDQEQDVKGFAARTFGTSSTGGDSSRYIVPETQPPLFQNRTRLVGVATDQGRLGTAVIEATTPRVLEGAGDILSRALAQDQFSLSVSLDAARQLLAKKARPDEYVSVAAVTVNAQGEVAMAACGSAAVLMVRGGSKLELIDNTDPVLVKSPTPKNEATAAQETVPWLESKKVAGEDHDQVVAATQRFWDLVSEYEVEKYAKRYRGEALQKVLFNLAFDRNNAVVPFRIQKDVNEWKHEQPAKGEGGPIALQVTHVELPGQRGFLSKLGRSKAGKWLRGAALVAFGFSGHSKQDSQPPQQNTAAIQITPSKGAEQRVATTPEVKNYKKITVESGRGNEHAIVRLVQERNKELRFLGNTPEDNGRKVLISAWTKQLLRGTDAGGFVAAEFNKNVELNKQGQFEFKNQGVFDDYLVIAADRAKERKHISTAIGYAEGTYADDLGLVKRKKVS